MRIDDLLLYAREAKVSDVHITAARNPVMRRDGDLVESTFDLSVREKDALIFEMMNEDQLNMLKAGSDVDFCYNAPNGYRYRVNVYRQQRYLAAAIRIINDNIPTFEQLNLPEALRNFASAPRGLVLVTGPTGSGKSTTLAAMIDYVNSTKSRHILTVEDPIEYVYKQKKSVIHQREVGMDVQSFSLALKSAMREDPDVILVGEMRDYETISAAITAAETGHLVMSTLHTIGAADTIDRIIDVFPPANQQQIRTQLSASLIGVVTQQLLPKAYEPGRVAAFEIMVGTEAILNLIRENQCHMITGTIQTSSKLGMTTLDNSLAQLVNNGIVTFDAAFEKARKKDEFKQFAKTY